MSTVRVLKLGGSLLLNPDWAQRLQSWLSAHPVPLSFLLVGGGEIVESVRRLDAQHNFPAPFSHWLCIDLLSTTARIAAHLLPTFPLISTSEELHRAVLARGHAASAIGSDSRPQGESETALIYLVDVSSFYSRPSRPMPSAESSQWAASKPYDPSPTSTPADSLKAEKRLEGFALPESWETTSDSLAAWLARVVDAQELVLFKSMTPANEFQTPRAWVEQGIVDAAFADALPERISAQIVNLLVVLLMSPLGSLAF